MDNIYLGTEAMTKNQNKTQESPGEMNNEIGNLVKKIREQPTIGSQAQ